MKALRNVPRTTGRVWSILASPELGGADVFGLENAYAMIEYLRIDRFSECGD